MGVAELILLTVAAVFVGGVVIAALSFSRHPGESSPVASARRASTVRASISTSTALIVFALAIAVHISHPLLQGVPFVLGPLAASVAGLAAFTALPAPSIDGAVRQRVADIAPRRLRDYSTQRQRATFAIITSFTILVVGADGALSKASFTGQYTCTALFPANCPGDGPYLFPGWLFSIPALILLGALAPALWLALRRIVTTPATAWIELSGTDTHLRSSAVRLTLRVAGASLVLTTGAFLGFAAFPLLNAPVLETGLTADAASAVSALGWVLLAGAAAAFVFGLVLAILAITGALRTPDANFVIEPEAAAA